MRQAIEREKLAAKVSDAWINFAREGNPNHRELPKWPAFTADKGPVMVLIRSVRCRMIPIANCDSY